MRVKSIVYVKPFRTGSVWHIAGVPLWCKIPFKIQINLYIHKYGPEAYNPIKGGGVGWKSGAESVFLELKTLESRVPSRFLPGSPRLA